MDSIIAKVERFIALKKPNSRRCIRTVIKQWCSFIGSERAFRSASAMQALEFLAHLRDIKKLADNTLHNRFTILRKVYRHLVNIEALKTNPFQQIEDALPTRQRVQVRPIKIIPFDKIEVVLSTPVDDPRHAKRDAGLLAVLFGGGLRRSEVRGLNLDDIQVSPTGRVFLAIKGAKSGENQEQSIPEWVLQSLSSLVSERKLQGATERDPLFVARYRDNFKRISDKTVWHIYKKACKKAGLSATQPHGARATAASYLKFLGHEDREVQQFLRHKHPGMVHVYDKRARGLENNPGLKLDFAKKVI